MARPSSRFIGTSLFAALLLTGCGGSQANPGALEQRLTVDMPLRSTSNQVIASLDREKIPHSPYHYTEASGNSIEAEIAVPAPHSLVQPTYDVVFRFDDQGHLKSYDIQYLGSVGL